MEQYLQIWSSQCCQLDTVFSRCSFSVSVLESGALQWKHVMKKEEKFYRQSKEILNWCKIIYVISSQTQTVNIVTYDKHFC